MPRDIHADLAGFGGRLRATREQRGLSVEDVSRASGCSDSAWSAWEHDVLPDLYDAAVAASVLGVALDWLAFGLDADAQRAAHAARVADAHRVLNQVLEAQRQITRAIQLLGNNLAQEGA